MNNNDILRRIRYTFNYRDEEMIKIFGLANQEISYTDVRLFLKKEEDPERKNLNDELLATFLNGWIILKRGAKDGPMPEPEKNLNNNVIFRKLKIALNLKDEDILEILKLADFRFSRHELSALFRKKGHPQYRTCKDQVIRYFLHGMQLKYHGKNK